MDRLRFDKADCKMTAAAIMLATSQWPWADRVFCSPYDWPNDRGFDVMLRIMVDLEVSFESVETALTSQDLGRNFHDILVQPSSFVPPGWVMLT